MSMFSAAAPVDSAPLVRRAAVSDDAALLALDRASWTPRSGFPSLSGADRTAFFSERRTPDRHLVAEVGGAVVGYVCVEPKTPLPEGAHVFAIRGLLVSGSARRLGVGSALLAAAERVALEQGARKLSLHVFGGNAAAIHLYDRHGYLVEGRCTGEFLIGGEYVDEVTMAKHLRP